jgi:hypothetical protein
MVGKNHSIYHTQVYGRGGVLLFDISELPSVKKKACC